MQQLINLAHNYYIQDQLLGEFCKRKGYSAVTLSQYGLALARGRETKQLNIDEETRHYALKTGMALHEMNLEITRLVESGIDVDKCLAVTSPILDPR